MDVVACGLANPARTDDEALRQMTFANTHLTFPHHQFDIDMRLKQAHLALTGIDAFAPLGVAPCIFGGDFNGFNDNVYSAMVRSGFVSSYAAIHGEEPGVTHRNHNGEDVCVRMSGCRVDQLLVCLWPVYDVINCVCTCLSMRVFDCGCR